MQKQAPSIGKILSMVVFALSCFGLLLFLWLSFGGPVPLKPERYRVKIPFAEATTLAQEADVRMAGVNIGKVKEKKLLDREGRTLVTIDVDAKYAPIPKDTRAILRQKTLLGETYVELTPGHRSAGMVPDGGEIPRSQVEPTVELDEIFQAFDKDTRQAFRAWVAESAKAVRGGTDEDLNDALGNLARFTEDGADVLGVLDSQKRALRDVIKNTGVVFRALSERDGQLRSLIENADRTFGAFASRDEALAETFRIFPTFLDESRLTLARLRTFSVNTRPLVRDLQPVADDLGPTVRDLGALAPDLRQLFRDLDPLIAASNENSDQLVKVLRGASPVFDQLHPFLQELNPILSFANWDQAYLSTFITHGPAAFGATLPPIEEGGPRRHYLRAYGAINDRSISINGSRPIYERGNAYPAPNAYTRAAPLGIIESFDCAPTGGEVKDPVDNTDTPGGQEYPPCFVQPQQLYDGHYFPRVDRGKAPLVEPPRGFEGTKPADPNR
jgi:phospholipid/cholesterol/gamma-HCH transport system substrate-binding protein